MVESRRVRRYECNEGVECELEGRVIFGLLQDVSLGGARLRGLELPAVGTLLRVAPSLDSVAPGSGRRWVFAQVCWLARGPVQEAGLRFLEPVSRVGAGWVAELVDASEPLERRATVRVPAAVPVEVRSIGKQAIPTWTVDLSLDGALVRAPQNLRPRERVDLRMLLPEARLDVSAVVVRPASPESAHHSMSFSLDECQREQLERFLREHKPLGRRGERAGLAWLELMNSRRP